MSTASGLNNIKCGQGAEYTRVAPEYYDEVRHPTSAALGRASIELIRQFLLNFEIESGAQVCDVGAGRSVVASLMGKRVSELGSLWLVDNAQEMLDWSERSKAENIRKRIMNADELGNLGIKFDLIVASLGDPYNTKRFWSGVSSALAPKGICIFTTPSYEWAEAYRQNSVRECANSALFELRDGEVHHVPSIILPDVEQRQLIEESGLTVESTEIIPYRRSNDAPPKLQVLEVGQPVVVSYVVSNPEKPVRS